MMDETIFFPSPNWFEPSTMVASTDGWLVYGGPSKSLCVLEPLPEDYNSIVKGQEGYTAHVVNRAHLEKVVCVDLCPEWPEKRSFLAGSADGAVKQWSIEKMESGHLKIKSTHSHEIHRHEEVVGVGYCRDGYAVTVGAHGNIVKWDLNSNVAKNFNNVLRTFKPTCLACSPHIHMNVAIGTKQGVVVVLDLNGTPRVIYKVRGQDNDVLKVSWCPQYEVAVRKTLKESDRKSTASHRMEKIRQEATSPTTMKGLDERVKNSQTSDKPIKINEKSEPLIEEAAVPATEVHNESGLEKTLPEDSFDGEETVVQEDDMFDIYTDHEADEFGHKKYQPENVLVKVPTDTVKEDYLVECERLKEEILKRKAVSEASIETLVDAMDKVQVDTQAGPSKTEPPVEWRITKGEVESSVHIHKHLLASIGKHGNIRIWSKAGKLVASCVVFSGAAVAPKPGKIGDKRMSTGACSTLLWCKPDSLLIADGKSQLLECNPLKIDCKNKLEWKILHTVHKRGMYAVAATAPRVQTPEMAARNADVVVWSAAQDRSLVRYHLNSRLLHNYMTCGGFLYMLQHCPYDARKVAVAVGDGAVRVWESEFLEDEDAGMGVGTVSAYWNNVQGKVLAVAWHPTKENLVAFSTAEARVGLIDITGKGEKPARVLQPACAGGIYSLCWGERMELYAAGAGELMLYNAAQPDLPPKSVSIELEGVQWEVSSVQWTPQGLVVGSNTGAVALCAPDHTVEAAAFLFKKMIHMTEWHPQETSSESEPSPYRNLIAVCALDRSGTVVILEYAQKEDGGKSLTEWKRLTGHKGPVLQVAWNPHKDHLLLSTSQDSTVRVWDVVAGTCTSIFGLHAQASIGVAWSARPAAPLAVLSGGADCTLRLWDAANYPAEQYIDVKQELTSSQRKRNYRRNNKKKIEAEAEEENGEEEEKEKEESDDSDPQEQAVAALDIKKKYNKKFLLPLMYKQTHPCEVKGIKKLLQKYYEQNGLPVPFAPMEENEYGFDFLKIFGTINEVNEVLDDEASRLLDTGLVDSWVMLCIVRGHIDACIQHMAQRDMLDPFLVSIAPCVSFKYWKDTTLLYLQQIDRLAAKGEESKLTESRTYGGAVYRRVAVLLSLHDVRGAVTTLHQARLYKEAYVLSRTRYMESLAEESLRLWADHTASCGDPKMAAMCYIVLGELSLAAAALGRTSDEEALRMAADIATTLGQVTYAGHMHHKYQRILTQKQAEPQEPQEPPLEPLPTRTQLLVTECERATQHSNTLSSSVSASKEHDNEVNNESDNITPNVTNILDVQNEDVVIKESNANKEQVLDSEDNIVEKKSSDTNDNVQDSENKASDDLNPEHKDVANESGYNENVSEESSDTDNDVEDHQNEEGDVLELDNVAQKFDTEKVEIPAEPWQQNTQKTNSSATKELLEQLPKMMKALMNESHQAIGPISNGTHIGGGDAKQNGDDNTSKVPEKDLECQVNSATVE